MTNSAPSKATERKLPLSVEPSSTAELDALWNDEPGWRGQLTAVQNDAVGMRMLMTGFFFLILGGSVDSFIIRAQLAVPDNGFIGPELYNQMFTNHGSVTMFLVMLPIMEGFAILILPTMLGAREMPFPRLGAYAYWSFLFGGLLYYSSTLVEAVPNAGWFAYTPLSGPVFGDGAAIDFWVLGLGTAEIGAIAGAVEITIAVLKLRAPGMSLSRIPVYGWAMLMFAVMVLFAFTPLIVGSLFLELDRGFGFQFFNPELGGSSLLWQHMFWIFGHPEVYIQFMPAVGVVSMIVPVMARRRLSHYNWVIAAMIGIAFLSFGLWAHHMFTVGLPSVVLAFFAAASTLIAIPAGVQMFAWVSTIWDGRPKWTTPMLFVIGFMVTFTIGGITGVMVASVPFDSQVTDSYFIVGHLHYVLIGGIAMPMFAAIYYWMPKFSGRMMSERLGRWNFWLIFIGVQVAFFPMHLSGLQGMPRRIYTYSADDGFALYNAISSFGALIILCGVITFIVNYVRTLRSEPTAEPNPWGADSLEWALPSPPPQQSWTQPPIVTSRHPLWDQTDLATGTPEQEAFVKAFGQWPTKWRAVCTVSTATGEPEEVYRVAGTSYWPLVTAICTVFIFFSELVHLRWGIGLGLLGIAASVVMWNRPQQPDITEEEELAFEEATGVPVRATSSEVIPRWATNLVILFMAVFFSSLMLAYYYLRLDSPEWPPAETPDASVTLPLVVAGLSAIATGLFWRARRILIEADSSEQPAALDGWLIGGGVVGALSAITMFFAMSGLPFSPRDNAYGSVFATTMGFIFAITSMGVIMAGSVWWQSRAGLFSHRRATPLVIVSRFWLAVTTMTVLGFIVLYASPWLTSGG